MFAFLLFLILKVLFHTLLLPFVMSHQLWWFTKTIKNTILLHILTFLNTGFVPGSSCSFSVMACIVLGILLILKKFIILILLLWRRFASSTTSMFLMHLSATPVLFLNFLLLLVLLMFVLAVLLIVDFLSDIFPLYLEGRVI